MNANFDMKLYRERWKAVEEIERQVIAKYNLIDQLLISLGINLDNDIDQM